MPAPAIDMMLQEIYSEIPMEILNIAFDPVKNQTTLDDRIITEVISGRVLRDVNARMGKTTRIEIDNTWKLDTTLAQYEGIVGNNYTSAFFLIPPEAREYRNIATVERVTDYYNFESPINAGPTGSISSLGNTVSGLAAAALESRTNNAYSVRISAEIESNNIIRVYPDTLSVGLMLECKLEYDLEMTNANQNIIITMQRVALAATKAWIWTNLVIKLDATAIVNGSPIGTLRDIVSEQYASASADYKTELRKLRAASLMDPRQLRKLAFAMIGG